MVAPAVVVSNVVFDIGFPDSWVAAFAFERAIHDVGKYESGKHRLCSLPWRQVPDPWKTVVSPMFVHQLIYRANGCATRLGLAKRSPLSMWSPQPRHPESEAR